MNTICTRCGHTTKPGLIDKKGICPVCQGKEKDEKAAASGKEKKK